MQIQLLSKYILIDTQIYTIHLYVIENECLEFENKSLKYYKLKAIL